MVLNSVAIYSLIYSAVAARQAAAAGFVLLAIVQVGEAFTLTLLLC